MKNYSSKGLVGVCIELKNNNYGSMLQSFATQQMLNNYGIHYELLVYRKKYTPLYIIKSVPRLLNSVVWQDKFNEFEKKKFISKHPEINYDVNNRNQAFKRFREKYFLAPIVTYYGYNSLKKCSRKYTAFFSGSDQLWSPSGLPTNFYNLMFAYDKATKISYASSFGVKKIPWYQVRRTRIYLNRIQHISCREESGRNIIKQLTGRDVPTVLDPTLLFDRNEWDKMLPVDRVYKGKYIFSYILGTDKTYREEVLKLSKEINLPIVSIHQYVDADLKFGDTSISDAGPAEFLNLIKNAEYVCTDSFHGSVFSIIYHKKFIVFNRYKDDSNVSKNTRIDNLCLKLNLQNRRFSGDIIKNMLEEINYDIVEQRLELLKNESNVYLEQAFEDI